MLVTCRSLTTHRGFQPQAYIWWLRVFSQRAEYCSLLAQWSSVQRNTHSSYNITGSVRNDTGIYRTQQQQVPYSMAWRALKWAVALKLVMVGRAVGRAIDRVKRKEWMALKLMATVRFRAQY